MSMSSDNPRLQQDAAEAVGLLEWGVKAGFRRYVQTLLDGLCDISPEITLPGQGTFGFPLIGSDGTPPARFRGSGSVTFLGHGGLLAVAIADPWLTHDAGTWRLTCRAPAAAEVRVELAAGRPVADLTCDLRVPLLLSDAGTALFGGNYPPGEPLDDLIVRIVANHP